MNDRNYEEALDRILREPHELVTKRIEVEYDNCDEKPLFYNKLLATEDRMMGFVDAHRTEFTLVQNYCWKKINKSIKLFRNPDNLSKVLKHTLTVNRLNSTAVLRGYYELTTDKKIFYKEILRLAKDPNLVQDFPYKTDAIRQFCEEQIRENNWLLKNDSTNLKWLITSSVALAGFIVALLGYNHKKTETPQPIIIKTEIPASTPIPNTITSTVSITKPDTTHTDHSKQLQSSISKNQNSRPSVMTSTPTSMTSHSQTKDK